MAGKGDRPLLRIGAEGFNMLGIFFPTRYAPPPQPQGPQQLQQQFMMECREAAKKYGGIEFVDPRERKPVKPAGKGYRYYDVD